MKKEKIITRTIGTLCATVVGIGRDDIVITKNIEVPLMPDKKVLPYLMAKADDSFTPAKIIRIEQVEQLYGMPESLFIKYAVKLPPRKDYNIEKEG